MTRQRSRVGVVALLVVALLLAVFTRMGVPGAAAVGIADYTIDRIGGPDADNTYTNLFDVNDAGTVVGNVTTTSSPNPEAIHATAGGGIVPLGLPPDADTSTAAAINEGGQIVGFMGLTANDYTRAFLYPPLVPADILTTIDPLPGFTSSAATDINDAGQVAGYDTDSTFTVQEAFLWTQADGLTPIPNTLGGTSSAAAAINEAGQVVGYADDADSNSHAFLWTATGGMTSLTPLYSSAAGINEAGQVAGYTYTDADGFHVFLWSAAGGLVDLGAPLAAFTDSVTVTAINDLGQITGYANDASGETHAFVWLPSVGFVDLGAFGGTIGEAFGINNQGQIVIYTNDPNASAADRNRGLLLTPQGDTTPPATTATPAGTAGSGGWFRSDVTVNLAATDNPGGFGVARITYSATGAQMIPATNVIGGTAAPVITAEGETTLTFFATDNATNRESPAKTLTVRIDKTPPALTTTLDVSSAAPGEAVGITVTTDETLSGPPSVTVAGPCLTATPVTVSAGPPDTYTASFTVPAGTGSCTITVAATGTDVAGNPSTGGTATFASLGAPPAAIVAPTALDFGNQLVGTTGTPKQVTLTNTGGRPLVIAGVALGGTDPGDFTIAYNSCAGNLVAGQSCVVAIAFAPTVVGAKTASLAITDDAASSPQTIALAGTGAVGTFHVAASATAGGTVSPPGTTDYAAGSVATYTATADAGQVFLGWTLDGVYVGYASPLDFTVNGDRTLAAAFAPRPVFSDVAPSDPDYQAITFLAALGIVNPNGINGSHQFQPNADVKRAEVAAFVARVFGWQNEFHSNFFPDRCDAQGQNCVDDELWNDVAALADYGVVGGYTDTPTCASAGTTAPCYLPRDLVKRVQVLSIIARAFIKTPAQHPTAFWDRSPADLSQYTNVPDTGTQRSDLTTYHTNAGPVPGETSAVTFPNPEDPGSRRFVIAALFQAFAAQYSTDNVP